MLVGGCRTFFGLCHIGGGHIGAAVGDGGEIRTATGVSVIRIGRGRYGVYIELFTRGLLWHQREPVEDALMEREEGCDIGSI